MKKAIRIIGLLGIVSGFALSSGCASYRTSSNVDSGSPTAARSSSAVVIAEDAMEGRSYQEIGPIEVTVKKLTAFHKNPTKEQVNKALVEKAGAMGADAVINVKYKSGVGLTTWGYMKGSGTAVKFTE